MLGQGIHTAVKLPPDGAKKMLRLPIERRAGCACFPIVLVAIMALVLLLVTRACITRQWVLVTPTVIPTAVHFPDVPTTTGTLAVRPTETVVPVSSPAPTATPTSAAVLVATPTATQTPAPPTSVPPTSVPPTPVPPTPVPPTATSTATSTPSLTPTSVPVSSPTPTSTPVPTSTPTATREPRATEAIPPGWVACDALVRGAIERAAEVQAQYMEGTLPAGGLRGAWGAAAGDAQTQADRMILYRGDGITGIEITDVAWELSGCRAQVYEDWVDVTVGERWTYGADLTCASATGRASSWIDVFPGQEYVLVRTADGWRVNSWLTGPVEMSVIWTCQ